MQAQLRRRQTKKLMQVFNSIYSMYGKDLLSEVSNDPNMHTLTCQAQRP